MPLLALEADWGAQRIKEFTRKSYLAKDSIITFKLSWMFL